MKVRVTLDISMAGMDGFEVCTRLKADAQLAELRGALSTEQADKSALQAELRNAQNQVRWLAWHWLQVRAACGVNTRPACSRYQHEMRCVPVAS